MSYVRVGLFGYRCKSRNREATRYFLVRHKFWNKNYEANSEHTLDARYRDGDVHLGLFDINEHWFAREEHIIREFIYVVLRGTECS